MFEIKNASDHIWYEFKILNVTVSFFKIWLAQMSSKELTKTTQQTCTLHYLLNASISTVLQKETFNSLLSTTHQHTLHRLNTTNILLPNVPAYYYLSITSQSYPGYRRHTHSKMATAEYTPSPFPCSIVVVQTTGRHGKTFHFEKKNWCVLGANEDCDIIVPFAGVAQLQALIHVKRNGVFLQGIDKHYPVSHTRLRKELLDEEEVLILPGDTFLLGNRQFLVEYSAEHVCIETSDAIAQQLSGESSSARKTTSRSRRRRKSSIKVGEFDEVYVSPANGSEKLLSDSQLARVSRSEAEILPQQQGHSECEDEEPPSPQNPCNDELMRLPSTSSDESAVLSSEEGSVSRIINFESTSESPQESESCRELQIPATSAVQSKGASEKKQRRNLVFDRLSKGLPATPRRREQEPALEQRGSRLQIALNATSSNAGNIPSGKENVPLLEASKDSDVKKDKDVPGGKDLENAHIVRSPLTNRVELENQATPPTARIRTPAAKSGVRGSARPKKQSSQTPRSRSVAFASTIELARGAHYSPFRPRKMTPKSGSAARMKKHAKEVSEKVTRSATRSNHPSTPVPSGSQKEGHLSKQPASNSGLASISQPLQQAMESQDFLTSAKSSVAKPVVEYEDDSYPPTPSSSEGEVEASHPPTKSERSPMARVGGALAGFLKRLSGNLESGQDSDSSFETDSEHAHKRLSFSEDLKESGKKDMPSVQSLMSSEPVMSSVELKELSQSVPPEQRRDFVNQVLSAAHDVREVTKPVSPEHQEDLLNADDGNSATQRRASPEQDEEVDACSEKLSSPGHDLSKPSLQSLQSDSTGVTMGSESSGVYPDEANQHTSNDNDGDDGSTNGSSESDVHSSIDSGESEGLRFSRSTSLEVTGSNSDTHELEMEMEILRNVNVNDATDDEDAVERDYEDDPWDDVDTSEGNESEEHEVTAVILDDEVDIQSVSGFGLTKLESGFEQRENMRDTDEDEDSSHESHTENLDSITQPFKNDDQRVSSLDQDSDASKDFSVAFSEETSSAEPEPSTSSTAKGHQKYDNKDVEQRTSSPEMKTKDGEMAVGLHLDEVESRKELSRLKKDELKKRLHQRGLNVEGLKKDLVERLAQALTFPATNSKDGQNPSESAAQDHEKSDEEMVDLTNLSDSSPCHVTPKRSLEKTPNRTRGRSRLSTRRLTRQSLVAEEATVATVASPETPKTVRDLEHNVGSKNAPDISLYRRRTMRELRQFLKDSGLDTQLKMRKDELIQHLISHSIGSDGQLLEDDSNVSEDEKALPADMSNAKEEEKILPKSSQKMTVVQIRALLREQGQCQAGTKKTLLERLTAQPERRTRSRRVLDVTSCALCQEGKTCEAGTKK